MEHLALWHDGRFAQCVYFLTALMNMLQRHHVAREVRGRIMNSTRVQDTLSNQVLKPEFKVRLQNAIKDPDGKEGKEIRKMLEQIVLLGSSSCPFSPGERRSIQPRMFANNFFFGLPNFFNTIAPDHFFAPLLLRETRNPVHGNEKVPTDISDKAKEEFLEQLKQFPEYEDIFDPYKAVTTNPVRSTMYFNTLMNNVANVLYGIPWSDTIRKTIPIEDRAKGIFSLALNVSAVNEVGGRDLHHGHHLLHAGIDARTVSEIAEDRELRGIAVKVLDNQHMGEIALSEHERRIMKHMKKKKGLQSDGEENIRPILREVEYPLHDDGTLNLDFFATLSSIQGTIGNHSHSGTCRKPPRGLVFCRLMFPKGINNWFTRPLILEYVVKDAKGNIISRDSDIIVKPKTKESAEDIKLFKKVVSETVESEKGEIPPLNRMKKENIGMDPSSPFPPMDKRVLLWDIRRREINIISDPVERAYDYLKHRNSWEPSMGDSMDVPGPLDYHGIALFKRNVNGFIVDYNPIQTMALRCNTCCYYLGSDEQAKSTMMYMVEYFSKDGVMISNALSYALTAKVVCERFPGESVVKARDVSIGRITDEEKTEKDESSKVDKKKDKLQPDTVAFAESKKFCNAFINQINGASQLSLTQCAAALLGIKSFRTSYGHWAIYIDAALQYVIATYNTLKPSSTVETDMEEEEENAGDITGFVRELFHEEDERVGNEIQMEDTTFMEPMYSGGNVIIENVGIEDEEEEEITPDTLSSSVGMDQPMPKKQRINIQSKAIDTVKTSTIEDETKQSAKPSVTPLSIDTSISSTQGIVSKKLGKSSSQSRLLSTSRTQMSGLSLAADSKSDMLSDISSGLYRPMYDIDRKQSRPTFMSHDEEDTRVSKEITPTIPGDQEIEDASDHEDEIEYEDDETVINIANMCKDFGEDLDFGQDSAFGTLEIVESSLATGKHGIVNQHINYR